MMIMMVILVVVILVIFTIRLLTQLTQSLSTGLARRRASQEIDADVRPL